MNNIPKSQLQQASAFGEDVYIKNIRVDGCWPKSLESTVSGFRCFLEKILNPHEVTVFKVYIPFHQKSIKDTVYAFASFVSPNFEYCELRQKVIEELNQTAFRGFNLCAEVAGKRKRFMVTVDGVLPKVTEVKSTQTTELQDEKVSFINFN
jgi:hypothetical protein